MKLRLFLLIVPFSIALGAEPLAPMLDLAGTGRDPTKIDFARLPVLAARHALVTRGERPWVFRLHNYLAFHDGQYWCMWSHGPIVEDNPTQYVRFATSPDGLVWTDGGKIMDSSSREGFRYIARGLWVRDGKLIALASHDEAFGENGRVRFFGRSLELLAWEWQPAARTWAPLGRVFDHAINNFPPAKMPNGEWGMICRGPDYRRDVFMLTGGVNSVATWTKSPVVTEASVDGFRPEEPDWWTLPDGRLLGLFRDNAKSGRYYRAVSSDNGRTWSAPEKTNFPDATSKFFCLRTSRGYYVMVSNANPAARNPLCLSTSEDGVTFTRMARLPVPEGLAGLDPNPEGHSKAARTETYQYPHAIEHDGQLLVAYSRRKMAIEVLRISLDEIDALRRRK